MSVWYVMGVFAVVFVLGYLGAKWAVYFTGRRECKKELPLDLPISFVLLVILGLGGVCFSFAVLGTVITFYHMMLAMGLVCLAFMGTAMRPLMRALGMVVICFLSTYFLPQTVQIQAGLAGTFEHLWLGVIWALMVWVFAKMDRVPFMSMILSTGFAACMFLLSSFFSVVPIALGYFAIAILIAQMGMNMFLKNVVTPKLGYSASVLVGFLWGAYAIYFLALGYTPAVVILYGYPTMEVLFAAVVSFGLYQNWESQSYLVEQALAKNIFPQKVLKAVMMWMLLIAALAALSIMSLTTGKAVFYIALAIVLINIYIRLTSWGEPKVRLRDVGADLKKGLSEVKKELQKLPFGKKNKTADMVVPESSKSEIKGTNKNENLEKVPVNADIIPMAKAAGDLKARTKTVIGSRKTPSVAKGSEKPSKTKSGKAPAKRSSSQKATSKK